MIHKSEIEWLLKSAAYSKMLFILCACCVFGSLIIAILAYRSLTVKLHNKANRLHEVETELLNQRCAVTTLEKSDLKSEMIERNEVPMAIAELTREGRYRGLNFSSISPGALQSTTQADIGVLPISITIESEYKNIGQFLSYVEDFPCSIVEIESLSIRPRKGDQSKLNEELILNLYVEISNAAQK
jgi:Tfp pilus assembly protein PilO